MKTEEECPRPWMYYTTGETASDRQGRIVDAEGKTVCLFPPGVDAEPLAEIFISATEPVTGLGTLERLESLWRWFSCAVFAGAAWITRAVERLAKVDDGPARPSGASLFGYFFFTPDGKLKLTFSEGESSSARLGRSPWEPFFTLN